MKKKVVFVFGTRPEAIKMCPVIKMMEVQQDFEVIVCLTGQHAEICDKVLDIFKIKPQYNLEVMSENQSLNSLGSKILFRLDEVLAKENPDYVVVHGDTTTTAAAAMAAYYRKISVCHVEAGLRTGDIYSPWPEEGNRKICGAIADFHFAPTLQSKNNLLKENVKENKVWITGNTVIDALIYADNLISSSDEVKDKMKEEFDFLDKNKKTILVTAHRRENFGEPINNICDAILFLANKHQDLQFVLPVHPNPNVRNIIKKRLGGLDNIFLINPLEYLSFVYIMSISHIILSDSGGVQEEAPSLGKPVLVLRDTTERPEAVEAGTVRLVGSNTIKIIDEFEKIYEIPEEYEKMTKSINPYGDGKSSERIVNVLRK